MIDGVLQGGWLDQALFPLLVRLATWGPLSMAALSAQVGRDSTTISRQVSKLEGLGLVLREVEDVDRRVRMVRPTEAGRNVAQAVTAARQQLLARVVADWPKRDVAELADLNRRFFESLTAAPPAYQ